MMDCDQNRLTVMQDLVAPDNIWTLGEIAHKLLGDSLRRLSKKDVSEDERRYPTTQEGLRAFLDGFFARHYFQVQDSLLQYFASTAFESAIQRGTLHVADVGCGPAVASFAIAELANATLESMSKMGTLRGKGVITINFVLNDTSKIGLDEGCTLLAKYSRIRQGRVTVGRVLPLSMPFPDSITQFRRISHMTTPYDLCCLGYVLVPLSEQIGVDGTAEAIRRLAQAGNSNGGQLLLTQDKFREDLHSEICLAAGIPAEMAELKQRVYDSENQNSERTYTYCRSCSPIAELAFANSKCAFV